jgi:hypothetical protein
MYVLVDKEGYYLAGMTRDLLPTYSQVRAMNFNSAEEAEAKKQTIHRAHRENFVVAPMPDHFTV